MVAGTRRQPSHRLLWALVLVWAMACGDDVPQGTDATEPNTVLLIETPPGDDLGLGHNERITLRVRYQNQGGARLVGEVVEFALVATGEGEDTAGSALSATDATTDADGIATVDLIAGVQDASYRVSVDARDATTEYFFVEIADGGFASLRIEPTHDGWREPASFDDIEVRLYRRSQVTCAELDVDQPPPSLSPVRSLDSFGDTALYPNVAAGQAQVVAAWAYVAGSGVPAAVGCVEIATGQLPPGLVEFDVVVVDRPLNATAAPLITSVNLAPVVEHLDTLGVNRLWQTLGCDAGLGQVLLDCTLDALVPDGALDCQPGADSPLSQALGARRGALQMNGCRPDVDDQGGESLDRALSDAVIAGGGFASGAELAAVLQVREQLLAGFILTSELTTVMPEVLEHRLAQLQMTTSTGDYQIELTATSRPVIVQQLPRGDWSGMQLTLPAHGYTLRYGSAAFAGFRELGLLPAGLAGQAQALGSALAGSVQAGVDSGCPALSTLSCQLVGEADTCALVACEQGVQALDGLLSQWWQQLDGAGIDGAFAGTLQVTDDDGDLQIESIVVGDAGGTTPWTAVMTLADGTEIAVPLSP